MELRQWVLDTETTGLEPELGHRIIEIGAVELVNRRLTGNRYHQYLNPDREVDPGALQVHGITNEFLQGKPHFADVVDELLQCLQGAELIIHNAPFDLGFLNHELRRFDPDRGKIQDYCSILDTLVLARKRYPGQKNSLDALCKRLGINNSHRELHGALLDAEILADVYLLMTGGQTSLQLDSLGKRQDSSDFLEPRILDAQRSRVRVIPPTQEELVLHEQYLDRMERSKNGALWRMIEAA